MQKNQNHNLYCIDCIEGSKKYLQNESVDIIITDPPYGIKGNLLHRHYNRNEDMVIDGYVEIPQDEYSEFSHAWISEAERVLRPGGTIYIISGHTNLFDILAALRTTCLEERNHIIWKYNFGVYTTKKFVTSHYHILYYVKPRGQITFNTYSRYGAEEKNSMDRSLNYQDREDVWVINREYKPREVKNKNELPRQLLIKLLQYSSNQGDLVVDFFLGGFSTARMALELGRRITGFEINPKSFNHHMAEIDKITPGESLSKLNQGKNDLPTNQRKPWSQAEFGQLKLRFEELHIDKTSKRQAISILQKEFGRGYFAILNKISEISGK